MSQAALLDPIWEQLCSHFIGQAQFPGAPVSISVDELGCSLGTHTGSKRRRNEDRCTVAKIEIPGICVYSLAMVCDGVGGSKRGDEAASMACASAIWFVSSQRMYVHPAELIDPLVRTVDDIIRESLLGAGLTTLTLLLSSDRGDYSITSVGDSRIYSWDIGSDLIQLLDDETIENEFKHLKIKNAAFLRDRGLQGSLSQALGENNRSSQDLNVRVVTANQVPPGGFLLASDGIWKQSEDAFQKITKNSASALEVVRRTIVSAQWLGGSDNATAICIKDPNTFCAAPGALLPRALCLTVWTPSGAVKIIDRSVGQSNLLESAPSDGSTSKEVKGPKKAPRRSARKDKAVKKNDGQMSLVESVDGKKVDREIYVEPGDN